MSKSSESRRGESARPLADLPSMTQLLEAAATFEPLREVPRTLVVGALRSATKAARDDLRGGAPGSKTWSQQALLELAAELVRAADVKRLVRVINATGVVLHTNLGRSVLADEARSRVIESFGYCNLEMDLLTGERGHRGKYGEELLCQLTGAEAALVVNNNAAATMLVLHGLAKNREVIVSRGQLVEIGGSFRLPEVMTAGGSILREIGTTNKTHLADYENAVGPQSAMIMHVHTSNYRVVGFTGAPDVVKLCALAHQKGLILFDDLGSGALLDDELWSEAGEPTARASLAAGADVIAFSGDKLLGGPQAGILLGKSDIVERLRSDPMARALRLGKLSIAALEATLEIYLSPETVAQRLPLMAGLKEPLDSLIRSAETLADALTQACAGESFTVANDETFAGGGSLPDWPFPTVVVRWTPSRCSVDQAATRLRGGKPPVVVRVRDGAVLFDLRTIRDDEFAALAGAVSTVASAG
jgi:L-seryl-tRNA(Ser) seleniumtransferase